MTALEGTSANMEQFVRFSDTANLFLVVVLLSFSVSANMCNKSYLRRPRRISRHSRKHQRSNRKLGHCHYCTAIKENLDDQEDLPA